MYIEAQTQPQRHVNASKKPNEDNQQTKPRDEATHNSKMPNLKRQLKNRYHVPRRKGSITTIHAGKLGAKDVQPSI